MRKQIVGVFVALATIGVLVGAFIAARPAQCDWCVATFCGSSAECPGDCVCAIPWGEVTGECSGTR